MCLENEKSHLVQFFKFTYFSVLQTKKGKEIAESLDEITSCLWTCLHILEYKWLLGQGFAFMCLKFLFLAESVDGNP